MRETVKIEIAVIHKTSQTDQDVSKLEKISAYAVGELYIVDRQLTVEVFIVENFE